MAKENHCPQCGAELMPNAPEGLCPRCLMKVGLEGDADVTLESPLIEGPGTTIGRYKLLELIGEGGMGLVYLAEQQEPIRRKVALKIVKLGMDTKQVIARFEAERQVLALLDHSNIARVLDAGTTETGRPYFVMEYVKGMSITKYCDRHKLSVEKRLKLFLRVCEAVHHAHQKGIIHRDIKPANILVSVQDDRPVPKIIDFGIAKAVTQPLTERTLYTRQGQLLGTPEYMSPEQADMGNEDIDTRADIYSLGVVLYELLAGALPFEHEVLQKVGFAELQRILQEEEPPHPSIRLTSLGEEAKEIAERRHTQVLALARRLHRELEWIPLKAMRKDRSRRYRSASELADDIQNYLSGAPLIAGPETAVYRVKKFVRKHAGSVATVALVAAVIVLGLIVSTVMYIRAERMRVLAEQAEKVAEERGEEYRRLSYVHGVALADAKYHEGNIRRLRELLESCPNDLRGWEWYRLNHIADKALMTLRGHTDRVYGMAISPDGKRIASGSEDKTIKVWDAGTGTELMTLHGHGATVTSVAFGQDGRRIASGSGDKTIKVWDAATGAEVMTLRGHESTVWSVAFSPDSKRIISAGMDIKVWDVSTGNELMTLRGHERAIRSVAFSPDGKRIVSGGWDKSIKVWDSASGTEVMTLRWHESPILSVAFSPDGKRIVSGGVDSTVKLWDAATGEEVLTLAGHNHWVKSVTFSPDGKRVISGSFDNTIKVWDAETGAELMTLRGHEGRVWTVEFSPDGKRIVSSSEDKTIKVWDAAIRGDVVTLSGHEEAVGSIAFSPDGKRLVSGSEDGTVKLWDAATGAELMTLLGHGEGGVYSVAFSPDGKRIVSSSEDKTIKIWDAVTGNELMTLRGHKEVVIGVSFSPDGKRIVSGGVDSTLKLWDAATGGELMTLGGHSDWIQSVAFSPDGKRIVSGGNDKTIKVWDVATGTELMTLRGHEHSVGSVSFSPDGELIVSSGWGRTVKLWDAVTGTELMNLPTNSMVGSVTFSPDGKRIISGGGNIMVWDVASGRELMTLRGHGGAFSPVAFSPDGKTIAAGIYDSIIKLWESTTPAGGYELRWNAEAARKVVDELYKETGFYSEVIDKLNADNTLAEPVRKVALQIANSRHWEDAEKAE